MAELKSNKKALDSQKIIYKRLRRVLLSKSLIDVTVQDVCSECQISRSSFYRNFKNIIDVLDVMLDFFYNRYLRERDEYSDQLEYFFTYWHNHRDLINILKTQNIDILRRCMEKNDPSYSSKLELEVRLSLFSTILSYWSNNKDLTNEEMIELVKKFIDKKEIEILINK